jgi:uncharacterized protein
MSNTNLPTPTREEINLAVLMHIGGIFFNFIPSLIVYLAFADNKPWLKEEAKDALNFELTTMIYYFIAGILVFVAIGLLLLPLLWIGNVILTFIGIINVYSGKKSNLPFVIKFLR